MKKIHVLLFIILTFVGTSFVHAEVSYSGNCICVYNSTQIATKSCSSLQYPDVAKEDFEDNFIEGICERVCSEGFNSGYFWCGKKAYQNDVACKTIAEADRLRDCVLNEDKPVDPTSTCDNNLSEAACEAEEGDWDEDTKCCTLKKWCWLYSEDGDRQASGKLYYQEQSPCTPERAKEHPNQDCRKVDREEDKCAGTTYTGFEHDPKESEEPKKEETKAPDIDISHDSLKCDQLLDKNLVIVLKAALRILQIAGAIILIVKGMMMVIPAVASKDEQKLKDISGKLVIMGIVLLVILLLPTAIKLIGGILDFDLTCFE